MQSVLTLPRARPALKYIPFKDRFPKCYQQFLEDLKRPRTPVNYVPLKERFYWDAEQGKVLPVIDAPIETLFPPESQKGLWGGEGVIKGYIQRKKSKVERPFAIKTTPKVWSPQVLSMVLYSEVLDKYLKTEVTLTALERIDECFGLDMYLLKTPVQDLNSQLAFDLRRKILLALARKDLYPNDPAKREKMLKKYAEFIIPEEEAEWFGLNLRAATWKLLEQEQYARWEGTPLKPQLRAKLIEALKAEKLKGEKAEEKS
ncbi:39S ribosomal protein L28 [Tropilaelaps mercedesae]|uniref:Large ribosomal subunit protein bL28m n=1 Tax=Tropilaelaps mercedesae TaxID=418985 RepID=A0A1V9XI24_9ACAR|nr:39S ribosomal protein L28 [Tropilaelaps mercedesae]